MSPLCRLGLHDKRSLRSNATSRVVASYCEREGCGWTNGPHGDTFRRVMAPGPDRQVLVSFADETEAIAFRVWWGSGRGRAAFELGRES